MRTHGRWIFVAWLLFSIVNLTSMHGLLAAEIEPPTNLENLNPLAKLDPTSFGAFVEKPLFSSTRSLPDEAAQPDDNIVVTAQTDLNIRLLGVVISPGRSVARILDLTDDSRHSLLAGQSYQNWKVVAIARSRIQLSKGDETARYTLFSRMDAGMSAGQKEDPVLDDELVPAKTPRASHEPRVVRVITPTGLTEKRTLDSSHQDLVDFFGPTDGKK